MAEPSGVVPGQAGAVEGSGGADASGAASGASSGAAGGTSSWLVLSVVIVGVVGVAVGTAALFGAFDSSPSSPSSQPIASPNDGMSYRVITLSNGLTALLVSDPKTDQAAASVDVSAGSWMDPPEYQGLAHFLEHMLFLGSAQYPGEDEFAEYLASHGGASNAFTESDHTNFFFNVDWPYLDGALARFAGFFTSPTFEASATGRELKAVDSEHKKNLQTDAWREAQLLRHLSAPGTPLGMFGTGSLETLNKTGVRNALLTFHGSYYVAPSIRLAVLGRESLGTLERLARNLFRAVPSNPHVPSPSGGGGSSSSSSSSSRSGSSRFATAARLFSEYSRFHTSVASSPSASPHRAVLPTADTAYPPSTHRGLYISLKPVTQTHVVSVFWPLPPQQALYRNDPVGFVSGLLGSESAGSVLSFLKRQGVADALSTGFEVSTPTMSMLQCRVVVRDVSKADVVLFAVFAYINMLTSSDPQSLKRVWDEGLAQDYPGFLYPEHPEVDSFVSSMSAAMAHVKSPDLLGAPNNKAWNATLVKKALLRLRPSQAIVVVQSSDLAPKDVPLTEPIYKSKYNKKTLPADLVAQLDGATLRDVHLPRPNPYVPPRTFSLVSAHSAERGEDTTSGAPTPSKLIDTPGEGTVAWWAPSTGFKVPRIEVAILVMTPSVFSSPRNVLLTEQYLQAVEDQLLEFTYEARTSGLTYSLELEPSAPGLRVTFSGYSHALPSVISTVVSAVKHPVVRDADVRAALKHTKERLENQKKAQPYAHTAYLAGLMDGSRQHTHEELLAAVPAISPADVRAFGAVLFGKVRFVAFVYGDVSQPTALELTHRAVNGLRNGSAVWSGDAAASARPRMGQFPTKAHVLQVPAPNPDNTNSAVAVVFQLGLRDGCELTAAQLAAGGEVSTTTASRTGTTAKGTATGTAGGSASHHQSLSGGSGSHASSSKTEAQYGTVEQAGHRGKVKAQHPYQGLSASRFLRAGVHQLQLSPPTAAPGHREDDSPRTVTPKQACLRRAVITDALRAVLQEPAFNELRTKQQLGYIVGVRGFHHHTWTAAGRGDQVQAIMVTVQGAEKDATTLDERVNAFVAGFETVVRGVSDHQWQVSMRSVRSTRLRRALTLSEAAHRLWAEIAGFTYRFHRRQEEAAALEDISVDEVVDLFKTGMLPSATSLKRVSVEVNGKGKTFRAPTGAAAATVANSVKEFKGKTSPF